MNTQIIRSIVPLLIAGLITSCSPTRNITIQPRVQDLRESSRVLIGEGLYRLTHADGDEYRYAPVLAPGGDGTHRVQVTTRMPGARDALSDITELVLVPGLQPRTSGDTLLISIAEIASVRKASTNDLFIAGAALGVIALVAIIVTLNSFHFGGGMIGSGSF